MKVKEMIEYLSQFNPEAKVFSTIKHKPFSPSIAWGSKEGCTKLNCEEVFIYVEDDTDLKQEEEIVALKAEYVEKEQIHRNVLLSDEKQIKNLIKRNEELRNDCIETARQRDILKANNQRQAEEIDRLRAELETVQRRYDDLLKQEGLA